MNEGTYKKLLIDFRKIRNNYKVSGKVAKLYEQLTKNSDILREEEAREDFIKEVSAAFFKENKNISQWKSYISNTARKIMTQIDNAIEALLNEDVESDKLDDDAEDLFKSLKRYTKEETSLLDDELLRRDIDGKEFAELLLDYVLLVDVVNDKVDFVYKDGGK